MSLGGDYQLNLSKCILCQTGNPKKVSQVMRHVFKVQS